MGSSFARRMAAAVALLVGFYVFALVVALGALALAVLQWTTGLPQNVWLTVACVVLGVTILTSIIPRRGRFVAPGPELTESGQPELHELVDDVSRRAGQEPPEHIYLAPDVNAAVLQRGGLLGLGGERVMLIGLPLLDVLTVNQLRAVTAHELGHFHAGDTRLGPWFYRTYDALERTVIALHEAESIWRRPFTWYFDFFLKRTASIKRRQEFVADELAATIAGKQTAIDTLSMVAKAAPAYDAFWNAEAHPILESGHRIPLVEGFRLFRQAGHVSQALDELLHEERKAATDPYDTHPALSARVAALEAIDAGEAGARDDRPAIDLLHDLDELEYALLATLADEEVLTKLETLSWADVPERVMVPGWRRMVEPSRQELAKIQADALPDVISEMPRFVARVVPEHERPPEADLQRRLGAALLATGLALTLHESGWAVSAPPGEQVALESNGARIEPFSEVERLVDGTLSADDWRARCAQLGIAGMPLGASAPADRDPDVRAVG
jgi:heat shock protein HtpX